MLLSAYNSGIKESANNLFILYNTKQTQYYDLNKALMYLNVGIKQGYVVSYANALNLYISEEYINLLEKDQTINIKPIIGISYSIILNHFKALQNNKTTIYKQDEIVDLINALTNFVCAKILSVDFLNKFAALLVDECGNKKLNNYPCADSMYQLGEAYQLSTAYFFAGYFYDVNYNNKKKAKEALTKSIMLGNKDAALQLARVLAKERMTTEEKNQIEDLISLSEESGNPKILYSVYLIYSKEATLSSDKIIQQNINFGWLKAFRVKSRFEELQKQEQNQK